MIRSISAYIVIGVGVACGASVADAAGSICVGRQSALARVFRGRSICITELLRGTRGSEHGMVRDLRTSLRWSTRRRSPASASRNRSCRLLDVNKFFHTPGSSLKQRKGMQDLFHEQDPSFECLNSRAVLRQSHQRLEKSTPRSDYVLLHVAAFHPLQGSNFGS